MKIKNNFEEMVYYTTKLTPSIIRHEENYQQQPKTFSDKVAKIIVHISSLTADLLFKKRYSHRAVVLKLLPLFLVWLGVYFNT
jgi:hypothetical protein